MAVGATPRLGLPTWGAGTDAFTRAQMNGAHQALDDLAGIDIQVATAGDLPAAALPLRGTYAAALDTGAVYRCNGVSWVAVSASSVELATSPPGAESFGAAGVAGTSGRLARADHRHAMPAHDGPAHAGVSLSALAAPTGALAMGGNRITNTGSPTVSTDAATKDYVDAKAAEAGGWGPMAAVPVQVYDTTSLATGPTPPTTGGTLVSTAALSRTAVGNGWFFHLTIPVSHAAVRIIWPLDMQPRQWSDNQTSRSASAGQGVWFAPTPSSTIPWAIMFGYAGVSWSGCALSSSQSGQEVRYVITRDYTAGSNRYQVGSARIFGLTPKQ